MIKLKIFISIIAFIYLFNAPSYSQNNVFIKYIIENILITNVDIENEAKYLLALNTQLKSLDNKKILELAEASIIREAIKRVELENYFKLNQKDPLLDNIIKDFYLRLKFSNLEDFSIYLKAQDLDIEEVKKKIEIENNWNVLIYEKYKDLVIIDDNLLIEKVKKFPSGKNRINYLLSEITLEKEKDMSLEVKFEKIIDSINTVGFKNTANLYSSSESAKFGGDIGWIAKEKLSEKLLKKIEKINVGEITSPIQVGNYFLILKLEEIKEEKFEIDIDKEVKTLRDYELNRRLNQYSTIHFNKIKINLNISEL